VRCFPTSIRRHIMGVLAVVGIFCLLAVTTVGANADTVRIFDPAGVLDASRVRSDAEYLPFPLDIYTINNFTGTNSAFDQYAISKIASPNSLVLAIDTAHHNVAIVAGKGVPLSTEIASMAKDAYVTELSGGPDHTHATFAAIDYLRNAFADQFGYFVYGMLGSRLLSTFVCMNVIVVIFVVVALGVVLFRSRVFKTKQEREPRKQRRLGSITLMVAGVLLLANGIFILVSGVGTSSGPGNFRYSSATTGATAVFIPDAFLTMRTLAIPGMTIGVMLLLIGLVTATKKH
jgi:hypothetical protein